MISLLLFALATLPRPGQQAGPWESVLGMEKVEYRWSRPAANSCLVELRNVSQIKSAELNVKTTFVTNRPMAAVNETAPEAKKNNLTVVKDQTEERQQSVRLLKAGTATQAIDGCYRIVVVKAIAPRSK
jgi:hypothetical protein